MQLELSNFRSTRTNTLKPRRQYLAVLNVAENGKGVIDVDTVKGCAAGMSAYPETGCYGDCYAARVAKRHGFNFSISVSRRLCDREHRATLVGLLKSYPASWYRVGVAGDPCHDWAGTMVSLRALRHAGKTPVIITKHWQPLTDDQLLTLRELAAVVNTSVSALDTDAELRHRLRQRQRLRAAGVRSVLRVVTCDFRARDRGERQQELLSMAPVIDNPLRTNRCNPLVQSGEISLRRRADSVGGGKIVSLHNSNVFLGKCSDCPDQCGVESGTNKEAAMAQAEMFKPELEWKHVESVIGSGYEEQVAKLAVEDGIAHRAARKNMQIHSAIILLVDGAFAGFMTFQINDECREFCLLQSVIKPELHTAELYLDMVKEVLKRNTKGYPALMTTNPKSKFETPKLFQELGFFTYLKMGEFHYMAKGDPADVRMKLLSHITMTNVWQSTRADWLRIKKEWKARIEEAGAKAGVINPMYATRDGCWNSFAEIVAGRSHNGNASVLDSTACEVILRFFLPRGGKRIYNPFGGGVQFGFVAGSYGYDYVATEIRRNQVEANNAICSEFPTVQWLQADSSDYDPEGMFDLVFTCPPYYRVEKYLDYDGKPPQGELNSLPSYETFRDTLFAGYRRGIAHLNDGCFFVVMTGDSRDGKGAFHCSEAETELFLRDCGLSIYNRIVYLESEFTRLAQAKTTLNTRKFPKREQKVIVAYKGDIKTIADRYPKVGRL
jgi:hypothetical protein